MISETIYFELDLGIYCFFCGFFLIASYDLLKICRYIIKHSNRIVGLEDIIYWLVVGFCIFEILYAKNNGILRGYAIGAMLFGMIVYNNIFSRKIVLKIYKIIDFCKKKLNLLGKRLKKP